MAMKLQMSDLRTRSLRRVNMETDLSVSTPELQQAISEVYGCLYGVVASQGGRYFETTTTITTTGTNTISEPADVLSYVDTIERVIDAAGKLRRLVRLMPQERSLWAGRTGHARRWEAVDDTINLYPTPPVGDQYVLRYIPQPPDLSDYA